MTREGPIVEEQEPKPCAAVVRSTPAASWHCPALAIEGSVYCRVHSAATAARSAGPIPGGVDRDVDVLPWTEDDDRIFATLTARSLAARWARRPKGGRP